MINIDILSFAINDVSDTFIKSMNQHGISFKRQFILESLAKTDSGFIFHLVHDIDNKVTNIVWITSYMCDNFEKFGNCISIDIMHSSICNAKDFCFIAPIIKNGIGKINIVCEGFVISETHDAYTFVLDSLFNVCPLRGKQGICYIFDKFMTKPILDSIGMNDTFIFYDHFNLKMNLEKVLLS